MTYSTRVPYIARIALSGEVLGMAYDNTVGGLETGACQGFWSYWFSAGVPVARSH